MRQSTTSNKRDAQKTKAAKGKAKAKTTTVVPKRVRDLAGKAREIERAEGLDSYSSLTVSNELLPLNNDTDLTFSTGRPTPRST